MARRKKKKLTMRQQRRWMHESIRFLKGKFNRQQYIFGLDISLHSTGIAVMDLKGNLVYSENTSGGGDSYHKILRSLNVRLYELFKKYPPAIIAFEEPTVAGPQNTTSFRAISYAVGVMYGAMAEHNVIVLPVNLKQLKKYETGTGSADKIDIIKSLNNRGFSFRNHQDDEADAAVLATMARDFLTIIVKYSKPDFDEKYVIRVLKKFEKHKSEVILAMFGNGKMVRENFGKGVFDGVGRIVLG